MRITAQIISWISLVVLLVPPLLFAAGKMFSLDQVKAIMLTATIVWFMSAPFWMWKEKGQ